MNSFPPRTATLLYELDSMYSITLMLLMMLFRYLV